MDVLIYNRVPSVSVTCCAVTMADGEEAPFQRDLQNFKQSAAKNFSPCLVIWPPAFYMRTLSGAQKECVRVARLLAASDEHFNLPANSMVPTYGPRNVYGRCT